VFFIENSPLANKAGVNSWARAMPVARKATTTTGRHLSIRFIFPRAGGSLAFYPIERSDGALTG
jgi:hypothetical protein